jgi:hypothetical protein
MNRRELLALAGAAVASTALPAAARASEAGSSVIALYDPRIAASKRFADAAGGATALEGDLVRQWRDGLGDAAGRDTPVAALVRWSDAFVLAGLLRENRRGASIDRMAGPTAEEGGSLFLLRA